MLLDLQVIIRIRNLKILPMFGLAQQKPKKKSSARVASQHTDKKREDSSNVQLAQSKPKKKSPAQVARDRARRREFWKRMRIPRHTLVNVNAPMVATTSWWLHFSAPVVA